MPKLPCSGGGCKDQSPFGTLVADWLVLPKPLLTRDQLFCKKVSCDFLRGASDIRSFSRNHTVRFCFSTGPDGHPVAWVFPARHGRMARRLHASPSKRAYLDEACYRNRRRISRSTGMVLRVFSKPMLSTMSTITGKIALSAACRAARPAGLIATILRRASSQSGRICT